MLKIRCSRGGFSKVTFLTRVRGAEGIAKAFRLAGRRRGTLVWTGVTVSTFTCKVFAHHSARLPTLPSTFLLGDYLRKKGICTQSPRLSK